MVEVMFAVQRVWMSEMSKHIENCYEFIEAKIMTIAGKQNLNEWRKCSRECPICSLFNTLESTEEA